jgi:copper chaperone CopZ
MARKEARMIIDGMICTSCATNLERALHQVDGVHSATVHWVTGKAQVEYDEDLITLRDLERAVLASGYRIGSGNGDIDLGFAGLPLYKNNRTITAIRP